MAAAWKTATQPFRHKLSIHNEAQGELTAFPCRVRLNNVNPAFTGIEVWNAAQDTAIDYQIYATGTNWIETTICPAGVSANAVDVCYLYYGNRYATDASTTDVWDANFVAVYPFTEQQGNYTDYTANNHDATTTTVTSRANTGVFPGYAAEFNGTSNYILVPDHADFDTGGAVTCEAMLSGTHSGSQSWIVHHDDSLYKYLVYISNTNYYFVVRTASGTAQANKARTVSDTSLHHIAGTFDRAGGANRVKVYTDGVIGTSVNGYNEDIDSGDEGLNIGGRATTAWWNGLIAEIRISNVARTADWIAATNLCMRNQFVEVHPLEVTTAGGTRIRTQVRRRACVERLI